ncbi:uncharacterized protein LOC125075491 [Vanessa atalanta]|uniref:uncharacterized protein LOC125075491 n=1 Tax=Vanessa atalanta TaxID=42275 RepID=UPI001FCDCCFB|nr:uncharacterized protein LOC125075491 [Vanessa atalanta]
MCLKISSGLTASEYDRVLLWCGWHAAHCATSCCERRACGAVLIRRASSMGSCDVIISMSDSLLSIATYFLRRERKEIERDGDSSGREGRFLSTMPRVRKLRIGFLNPGSLGAHHDEFMLAIDRHDVDIMALNETWLREGEEGRAPHIPGYRLRHKPRPAAVRGRGGGVGYYIRRGISARTLIHPITSPDIEQMWLRVSVGGKKLIIGTAYRPPWLNPRTFFDGLTETFTTLCDYDHIVLMGDFNINFLDTNNYCTRLLIDFLTFSNLNQIVKDPTHFTSHSETLIDLVCVDGNTSQVRVDYIHELSSHAFLSFDFNIRKEKPKPLLKFYRKINNITENDLKDYLTNFNLQFENIYDVNSLVSEFNSIRDDIHISFYKDLKSEVELAIHREKSAYFTHFINNNTKRPKYMWKHLKNIFNYKKKRDCFLPDHLSDPNLLNHFFLDLPGNNDVTLSDLNFYTSNRYCSSSFALNQVDDITVLKTLRSIKSKAIGSDGISMDMIYSGLPFISETIVNIVNTSIRTSTFPYLWKNAIVKPIPKIDNPINISDFRPISILPSLSKVLEKIVCFQLTDYLEANEILPCVQSGFRKGRSTSTALANVVDDVLRAQDAGEGTILVLLDFSRAFDTINLALLLSKLHYYGFSADTIRWFDSYLNNRSQVVEVTREDGSKCVSGSSTITRGVPQGSILGSVLFSLYCADIVNSIHFCNYHIYADDIQLYLSFKPTDLNIALNKLNEDLKRITTWSNSNCLILNPKNTKYMILGRQLRYTR